MISAQRSNGEVINATGMLIFPGLIDCHVHFREPGLEHKATMESESAAAVAGGVTTVCEMPNTIPPTVTVAALADKVRRAARIKNCDLRFFFGITEARHLLALRDIWTGNAAELQRLKRHCCGVKLYLDHSTGNQKIEGGILDEVFHVCAQMDVLVVCHCEDAQINAECRKSFDAAPVSAQRATPDRQDRLQAESREVSEHSNMRPPESETTAVAFAIGLAQRHGTRLHVAHLSTKDGLNLVRGAKRDGIAVTCEVAPHHLFLTVEDYMSLGTFAKMNPPLRTVEHRDALWEGLFDGTVDCIATDHAPHTLEEKIVEAHHGASLQAPSGVPGVETMLPLLLSVVAGHWPHPKGKFQMPNSKFQYKDIVRLCFEGPNHIFQLGKDPIDTGKSPDIILIDPQRRWMICGKELHAKCGWTPYEGWQVRGKVHRVIPPGIL